MKIPPLLFLPVLPPPPFRPALSLVCDVVQDRLSTAELLNSQWFTQQGIHGREEAVELMAEYLEGLYGPHAFKYFGDPAALEQPIL